MSYFTPGARGYLLLAGVLLAGIAALGVYAWQVDRASWEVGVMRLVQDDGPPGLRPLSIGLTVVGHGTPWALTIATIGLVLLLLSGLRTALLLAVVAGLQDVGALLKVLIERARPSDASIEVWRDLSSHSFPSGHTLGATLIFGFLFFAVEHCAVPRPLRRCVQAVAVLVIILMGLARMELGAHWPTDVLGAYLLGALLLLPIVFLLRRSVPDEREATAPFIDAAR